MNIEISSEDSASSSGDLPEVFMPCSSLLVRKRSNSSTFDPKCMDTDAIFDDLFQTNKKKTLKNLARADSGCIQDLEPDTDKNGASTKVSTASLRTMDSGISLRSTTSTDSEIPTASSSGKETSARNAKASKASEKEAKKQKLAEEKAANRAAKELNKVYKPGECMKFMNIEAHPSLLSAWYLADLQREASAASVRLCPAPDVVHQGLMLWSRRKPQTFTTDGGQAKLTEPTERCKYALLIQTAEEIAPHILDHTLSEHVAEVKIMVDCPLTLVVFGAKDYYSSKRLKKNDKRKFNELELEMSFTDLIVSSSCDAVVIDKPIDLSLLILQITKSLAEAPIKLARRACDETMDFYMRGDNKNCVAVDKDGHGLSRLWQQMLAVLPHCSLEASRAVCVKYPSPLELFEALQEPGSVSELANTGVARAAVPQAKARKLGPEFARRLAALMTADDGDHLLE